LGLAPSDKRTEHPSAGGRPSAGRALPNHLLLQALLALQALQALLALLALQALLALLAMKALQALPARQALLALQALPALLALQALQALLALLALGGAPGTGQDGQCMDGASARPLCQDQVFAL